MKDATRDKRCIALERGGHAPFIVLDDANLDQAVKGLATWCQYIGMLVRPLSGLTDAMYRALSMKNFGNAWLKQWRRVWRAMDIDVDPSDEEVIERANDTPYGLAAYF